MNPADLGCSLGSKCLLSSSMDKSLIIWKLDEGGTGLWLESARLGGVGGHAGGFYGGCWSPDGDSIIAHSFTGGLYMWNLKQVGWSPFHNSATLLKLGNNLFHRKSGIYSKF